MSENTRDTVGKIITDLTGQSRSEMFKGFQGFKDFTNGVMQAQTARRLSTEPIAQPIPQITSTELQSTGFQSAVPGPNLPTNSPSGSTFLKDMIVVLNGTADYTNIATDGRLDPV